MDAWISGDVWLRGATLKAKDALGLALVLEGARLDGSLWIDRCPAKGIRFSAEGCVWMTGVKIRGSIHAHGGQFLNCLTDGQDCAISIQNAEIGGEVNFCDEFNAERTVHMVGVSISRDVNITGGVFLSLKKDKPAQAINLNSARVGGQILAIQDTLIDGGLSGTGLTVDGGLILRGTEIIANGSGRSGIALNLAVAKIGGGMVFQHPQYPDASVSRIVGASILTRATIRGGFLAGKTTLSPGFTGARDGVTITAEGIEVEGDAFFDERANISGEMDFRGATFKRSFKINCSKDNAITWNLENASTQTLDDGGGKGWGSNESVVRLDGFRYESIETGGPVEQVSLWRRIIRSFGKYEPPGLAQQRLDWLRRHFEPQHPFQPFPYVQLAKVLRRNGHDEDSRHILHHKRWRSWTHSESALSKPFSWLFGVFFAFGYSTWHAIMTVLIFICIGTIGVKYANRHSNLTVDSLPVASVVSKDAPGLLQASPDAARTSLPCGNAIDPWLYAIDVFVPLIDLRQESKCEPSADADFWRWAKAVYALLGWIVTSLAILTFSGVLQRRGEDL